MQYRHHLLTLSKGGCRQTPINVVVWWILFECSSFDHFPNAKETNGFRSTTILKNLKMDTRAKRQERVTC